MVELSPILFWLSIAAAAAAQPIFVYKVCQACGRAGGRERARKELRNVLDSLRCLRRAWQGADESDAEIQEMVDKLLVARRVSVARTTIYISWIAIVIFGWARLAEALGDPPRLDAADLVMRRFWWFFYSVVTTLGVLFPKELVNERTLPIWLWAVCILGSIGWLLASHAGMSPQSWYVSWSSDITISLSYACFYLHFRSLLMTSFILTVARVLAFRGVRHECPDPFLTFEAVAVEELVLWLWKVVTFYCAQRGLSYSVKKEVEAALGKCQGSAVSALLGLVCDAVVDLDSDLAMKEHASKVAGLLMHSVGKSLRGADFVEFIAPGEDRQRFQEAMRPSGDIEPTPQLLTLRFRDSFDTHFAVALYHMPYISANGRLHHLIGLQETSDSPAGGEMRSSADRVSLHQRPLPAAVLDPSIAEALVVGTAGAGSAGQGSSDLGDVSLVHGSHVCPNVTSFRSSTASPDEVDVGCLVVSAQERLPILSADPPLSERLALAGEGRSLIEVLPGSHHLVERIVGLAGQVRCGALGAHIGNFGVWPIAPLRPGATAERYRVEVSFRRVTPGSTAESQRLKIRLLLVPFHTRRRESWRSRPGPLRGPAAGGGSSSRGSAAAPGPPEGTAGIDGGRVRAATIRH